MCLTAISVSTITLGNMSQLYIVRKDLLNSFTYLEDIVNSQKEVVGQEQKNIVSETGAVYEDKLVTYFLHHAEVAGNTETRDWALEQIASLVEKGMLTKESGLGTVPFDVAPKN